MLDLGVKPKFNPERWRFKVEGAVEESLDLSWEEFAELPRVSQISDFHCVTTWSKFDIEWNGVKFIDLASMVQPSAAAHFVVAHSFDEAEAKAEVYGCTVVGILDMIITEDEAAEWNRVLH